MKMKRSIALFVALTNDGTANPKLNTGKKIEAAMKAEATKLLREVSTATGAALPSTGDGTPHTLWFVILLLACAGFGTAFVLRRKTRFGSPFPGLHMLRINGKYLCSFFAFG